MSKVTRRRGYYFDEKNEKNYPAVSTITKSIGDSTGLIRWAVSQGAEALIVEVLKNPQLFGKAEEYLRKNGNKAFTTPALAGWAREIAIAGYESELRRTGDFGTMAHKMIENHILQNEQEFESPPKGVLQALQTYKDWEADIEPSYEYLEEEVINHVDKYGGRLDCTCNLSEKSLDILKPYLKKNSDIPNSGHIIVDVKTGSFHRDTHSRQLSAYMVGMDVHKDIKIDGGMVIHIERDNPEDLSIQFYSRESLDKGYKAFMACHKAWELALAPQWYQKENL